jgi:hypothetical protein
MSGSNFHQLKFDKGECIRFNTKRGETERYDATPPWAKPEKVNLTTITLMKKAGMNTDNLDSLPKF